MLNLFNFENVNLEVTDKFVSFQKKHNDDLVIEILKNFFGFDGEGKNLSVETPMKLLTLAVMNVNFANAIFAIRKEISYFTEVQRINHNRTNDISNFEINEFIKSKEAQHCISLLISNVDWMNNRIAEKLLERMAWIVALSVSAKDDAEILDAINRIIPAMVIVAIQLKNENPKPSVSSLTVSVLSHIEQLLDQKEPSFTDINCTSLLVAINKKLVGFFVGGEVRVDLLQTQKKNYKDKNLNDNEKLLSITLPKFILDYDGNAVIHCPELEANLSIPDLDIERAITYTLSENSCNCDHDCCGCASTTVSATVVNRKYIQMNVSRSENH